jgi:hypothetical protein
MGVAARTDDATVKRLFINIPLERMSTLLL